MFLFISFLLAISILSILSFVPRQTKAINSYKEYCEANNVVFGEQIDFSLFETDFIGEPKYGNQQHKFLRGKNNIGKSPIKTIEKKTI